MLENIRLIFVYVHLVACCIALGAILTSDVKLVARLLRGEAPEFDGDMHHLHRVVSISLMVLWATGVSFVAMDGYTTGLMHTLSNPKLQAKIVVVSMLTLNGFVLNSSLLPLFLASRSLHLLRGVDQARAVWAGAVSGVSWMYAAFFGIARPLSWNYPLDQLLVSYPLMILAGFIGMTLLTCWAAWIRNWPRTAYAPVS